MTMNQSSTRHEMHREAAFRALYPVVLILVLMASLCSKAGALPTDDQFIAGYACALLEREFQGVADLVSVEDGVIIIRLGNSGNDTDRSVLVAVLSNIRGVVRVEYANSGETKEMPEATARHSAPAKKAGDGSELSSHDFVMFPKGRLFEPLIADPRWPHFSVTYQGYIDNDELKNVGATSFGESFAFLRRDAPFGGKWELGIQAAVFAIFDLDADSLDLINADYWVGVPISYRKNKFSGLFRIFHQSSHLGDEYLLRNRVDRINLSYESVDIKVSCEFTESLRVYGGGGFLFHRDPSDLAPWATQCGLEMKSPQRFWGEKMRPIGGLDIQSWEETNWDPDWCLRMGIQLEGSQKTSRKVQFMLEYFNGHSPNGQFYRRLIEYIGIGTHLYF